MSAPVIRNMGASVRQRLMNHARATGKPFSEVLQYHAMERFLYRLSVSPYADRFLLKGALLLTAWKAPISRPTMDIDLLGKTDNGVEAVVSLMREVAIFGVPEDGIAFDPASFAGTAIREDADYAGVQTTFTGSLDGARVPMQIDAGFGDVVTPGPEQLTYPTILDFPAPLLSGYSRETVMAEKLQALTQLRDVQHEDEGLLRPLAALDSQRLTALPSALLSCGRSKTAGWRSTHHLSDSRKSLVTTRSKQTQWRAFVKRNSLTQPPGSLTDVVNDLRLFFRPLLTDETTL